MTLTMTYMIFSETKDDSEGLALEDKTIDLIDYIRPQNYIFSFGDLFIKLYDDRYEGIEVRRSYESALTSFYLRLQNSWCQKPLKVSGKRKFKKVHANQLPCGPFFKEFS